MYAVISSMEESKEIFLKSVYVGSSSMTCRDFAELDALDVNNTDIEAPSPGCKNKIDPQN